MEVRILFDRVHTDTDLFLQAAAVILLLFAESCVIESFSRFELDHGERFAVSSARSALALPGPRLLCAQVLCRLFPPSFPLLPAA